MSAPERIEWMAKPWEVSEASLQSDSEFGDNDDAGIVALTELVARRRAIEELKALATELLLMGLRPDGSHLLEIHDRIAAIEAEGS